MTELDRINESLGYDADVSDSRQYCRHGTFIGSWWGPDYLCHMCEMGYDYCEGNGCSVMVGGENYIEEERDEKRGFCRIPVPGSKLCDKCLYEAHMTIARWHNTHPYYLTDEEGNILA